MGAVEGQWGGSSRHSVEKFCETPEHSIWICVRPGVLRLGYQGDGLSILLVSLAVPHEPIS